jgi:hypothetical protein
MKNFHGIFAFLCERFSCIHAKIFKSRKSLYIWVSSLMIVSGCDRLSTIPYSPKTTPEAWLNAHPHVNISLGSLRFILMEPTSTFFVYLWGLLAVVVGYYFLRIRENHTSRLWWGIGLILWGVGALIAGVDHQAFTYQIKCLGREFCSYSSWWSIWFNVITSAGLNAIIIGVAHSSAKSALKRVLVIYAVANTAVYFIICLAGAFIPNRLMVSPHFMFLFSTPGFVFLFIINTIRYSKQREKLDLLLMLTWLFLGVVMMAYTLYAAFGVAEKLWEKGIWFTAPDVLHIGEVFLGLYIAFTVAKRVKDLPEIS